MFVGKVVCCLRGNWAEHNGVTLLSSLLGDITQKGYEKKKAKLLASYIQHLPSNTNTAPAFLPSCFSQAFRIFLKSYKIWSIHARKLQICW